MLKLGFGLSLSRLGAMRGGTAPPAATAPAQFSGAQWTLTDSPSAGGDKLSLNITALPSDGGSPITALQYSVGGGAWQTFAGLGTGPRDITVLSGALASVVIRAVNAVGNGTASTAKTATPSVSAALAAPSGASWAIADYPSTQGNILALNIISATSGAVRYECREDGVTVQEIFSFDALGERLIEVTAGASRNIELRGVDSLGAAGPWSTAKSATPSLAARATVSTATSYTYPTSGEALTFAATSRYVVTENGLHILTDAGDVTITAATPISSDISATGQIGNGMMRNYKSAIAAPFGTTDGPQGFDEMIGISNGGSAIRIESNQALNVHPSRAGNLVLANGTQGTISWCIRRAGAVTDQTYIQIPEKFIHITYGPVIPATQSFRGGLTSVDKKSIIRRADIDVTRLPSLTAYSGLETQANCLAIDVVDVLFGMGGEALQRINLHDALEGTGFNYSTNFARKRADTHHRLLSNATSAEKLAFMDKLIERANDAVALDSIGNTWSNGAGQFLGGLWVDLLLAYVTTRMPVYMRVARRIRGSIYTRSFFPQSTDVGKGISNYPASVGGGYRYQQPVFSEHVGDVLRISDNGIDSQLSMRYSDTAWNGTIAEGLALFVIKDWLGGEVWKDVIRPADFHAKAVEAHMHTSRKFYRRGTVCYLGSTNPETRHMAAWGAWLPLSSHAPLNVSPEQPVKTWTGSSPLFNNTSILATAGAGSITFDFTYYNTAAKSHSQHTITAVNAYLTLDNTQYHKFANVGYSPTISEIVSGVSLGRVQHFLSYSLENTYGESIKSPTFPYTSALSGSLQTRQPRFDATPTGTPANSAPAFVVNPKTYYDAAPGWGGNYWREVIGGVLAAGIASAKIGSGYCSGYPYPTMTYQHQRNTGTVGSPIWTDISGATASVYEFVPADIGVQVRLGIKGTNGSGATAFAYGDPITVPAAAALPAGVLLETNYSTDWTLYYPTQASTSTGLGGATKVHNKSSTWGDLETSQGGLFGDKTAGSANICIFLGNYPAGNYKLTYHVPMGYNAQGGLTDAITAFSRTIRDRASSTSAVIWAAEITDITANVSGTPYLFVATAQTFTLPSTQPVWLIIRNPTSTGGTVGGDPGVTYAKLENA